MAKVAEEVEEMEVGEKVAVMAEEMVVVVLVVVDLVVESDLVRVEVLVESWVYLRVYLVKVVEE